MVETSSLASVEPTNIWYNLSLPESIIDNGELSALQLEAVTYACQRHEIILPSKDRAGFLIGKYSRIFNFIILTKIKVGIISLIYLAGSFMLKN